jgi:nucleotide-binding universal stress UspA family protein
MSDRNYASVAALQDFRRARARAAMSDLIARITGKPSNLLSYEDVRHKLKAQVSGRRQLRDLPIAAIVGSVGRYSDFTRDFLPRKDSDATRWAGVRSAVENMSGVPPIEVYQIDRAYFVLDGNHRVSVARDAGASHIQAYVTEVHTRVPLTPDTSPDDLIIKAEYAEFLTRTQLDEIRPDADLSVTAPGQYRLLEEQIAAHRAALAHERGHEVASSEAVADWYDNMYLPVVQAIREQGILHDFPHRTETDLYIWIAEHRAAIEQELGWKIAPHAAITDLASQRSANPRRVVARLGGRLWDAVVPEALEDGPPPGAWRQTLRASGYSDHLVSDLLVAISGEPASWHALDQALLIAQREGARLAGLHVVPTVAAQQGTAAREVRAEFDRRCAAAHVEGSLAIDIGNVTHQICERAKWTDLVVASLSYPPGAEPIARLRSRFRTLIHRCPRPIVAVPDAARSIERALLPYDGSPKAEEALFAATYLALNWKLALTVVTVLEDQNTTDETLAHARGYLESHGVQASYHIEHGAAADAILATAAASSSDLILIGGYGFNPLLEIVLGSTVDQVLRASRMPVLICR